MRSTTLIRRRSASSASTLLLLVWSLGLVWLPCLNHVHAFSSSITLSCHFQVHSLLVVKKSQQLGSHSFRTTTGEGELQQRDTAAYIVRNHRSNHRLCYRKNKRKTKTRTNDDSLRLYHYNYRPTDCDTATTRLYMRSNNHSPDPNDHSIANGSEEDSSSTSSFSSEVSTQSPQPQRMTSVEPQVFGQRWIQLGYLSLLALLSDWICFSVAAAPDVYETAFPGHSASALIDMFLFCNVASCFLVTDTVRKIGLQRAVQGAAVLMAVGCWLRSGLSFLPPMQSLLLHHETQIIQIHPQQHLMSYPFVVIGTLLVGLAQPFFQCTPPLLSAQWFAASERATSTAVALNFNQIGIATAFLVGGSMATNPAGLEQYFGLIAILCTLTTLGSLLQFQNAPPIPPSASEMVKKIQNHQEPPFLDSASRFLQTPGFTQALAAFVCSISITNIVGAFIDEVMERGGIHDQFQIDLAGAGFELAILVGGIVVGGFVDRTKQYKRVTQICIALTSMLVIPLGLTEHAIGKEPMLLLVSLLGLGIAAGPVQPINAELAVDVTYPGDETAVESVQQIGGNLVSALLVPVAEVAAQRDYQLLPNIPWAASDIRGDVVLLTAIALATIYYYSSFDAPLKRSMADEPIEEDVIAQGPALNIIINNNAGESDVDGTTFVATVDTSSRSTDSTSTMSVEHDNIEVQSAQYSIYNWTTEAEARL